MSDGLFERLDRIEKLLIELVELARKNWDVDEPRKEAIKRQILNDEAPDLSDVWKLGEASDPNEKYYAHADKGPYEGMYDESEKDPYEGFYESEETKTAEVTKGEIEAKEVPQKAKTARGKARKRTGAPDYS